MHIRGLWVLYVAVYLEHSAEDAAISIYSAYQGDRLGATYGDGGHGAREYYRTAECEDGELVGDIYFLDGVVATRYDGNNLMLAVKELGCKTDLVKIFLFLLHISL
jgi:hypothetical protein